MRDFSAAIPVDVMNTTVEKRQVLEWEDWTRVADAHFSEARQYTAGPRHRRDRGEKHPVEDFLFDYYPYPLALIELWHPGCGTALRFPDLETLPERFKAKRYRIEGYICFADFESMKPAERDRLAWIAGLLEATQRHIPNFACHGLHEWAMVYRAEEIRHASLAPLRLPQEEIDALIDSRPIACTHHDAFRFFAKDARRLNRLQPKLETRHLNEQPGCVHANMDLYKWAAKSMPWIGSELLLDTFRLANELRDLDMRASPYDLSQWNVVPVKIETAEGRKQYEDEQRRLADKARHLRERLIGTLRQIIGS
ncbi:MAG: 3-methyladenine DNA glycosylase [Luteolibacter sp.]